MGTKVGKAVVMVLAGELVFGAAVQSDVHPRGYKFDLTKLRVRCNQGKSG